MFPSSFIELLKEQLLLPLPGFSEQQKMTPYNRLNYDFPDIVALNPKKSSVLIIIYPYKEQFSTVYIKRTEYKGVHSGQISFPGGKFEPSDITIENTALREAQEEIGVNSSQVEILGKLSDLYISVSNFLVTPFIGYTSFRPAFEIQEKEVAALIEVDLQAVLLAKERVADESIKTGSDIAITAPVYNIQGTKVWGATAMITSEFVKVVQLVREKM
ncbi:MAG: CoA pyrophosphatase [Bacteroidota bacterium]|nr:CoA pyrophosphatase [Bacteroidota bacterium]